MGENKYTPGPWEADFVIDHRNRIDHMKEESEANAHLISAAPDLLAACEEMETIIDWLDIPFNFCDDCVYRGEKCNGSTDAETVCPICKMRAAVSKAKGE